MIYIIDDDPLIRESLEFLFSAADLSVVSFATGREFLRHPSSPSEPCCLLLDLALPDTNGFDLYQRLSQTSYVPPVIFITGNGSVAMSVKAMKAGAFDFMLKPFNCGELLDSVIQALEKDRLQKRAATETELLCQRMNSLTDRELEVFQAVTEGLLNKQISVRLNIVEQTVKVHRARMMKKLHANSLAELVHFAGKLAQSGRLNFDATGSLLPRFCAHPGMKSVVGG